MKGLRHAVDGESIIPFVRSLQPSTCFWKDNSGEVHSIPQGEGGEQGDPLMPISAALQDGAFLDDLHIVYKLERVGAVHELLSHWVHSGTSLHIGKTKV